MAYNATSQMPDWDKITINFCHKNWAHHQPVELKFGRNSLDGFNIESDLGKIIVGLNGSGKSTLLKTIGHFFSLIGGFKHPSAGEIETFKNKCIERGVTVFQVEIEFEIHRLEPSGGWSGNPTAILSFPDLVSFDDYRPILEEESSLQRINEALSFEDDTEEEWAGFSSYLATRLGTTSPLTHEEHIDYLLKHQQYRDYVMAIFEMWAEECSFVKCTSKYSFEFLSGKFNSSIDIDWNQYVQFHGDSYGISEDREHRFTWASDELSFGPPDLEEVFMQALKEFENKFNTKIEKSPSAIVSLPLLESVYLSSDKFQTPVLQESAFSILDGTDLDSIELEIYLKDLTTNQILDLVGVERNKNPLRTYEEFPVDEAAGTIQYFEIEGRKLFHNNFQRLQVEMEDVNWIKAPTEIGELGRWDKHVNYHKPNTVWCVSFRSRLPRTKPITFDEVWGFNNSVLLRSHGNTICDLDHSIVYHKDRIALAEFIRYELFKFIDEKGKCEILSRIFKKDPNELLALYTLRSFGSTVAKYLTSGQQRLYSIFTAITKQDKTIFLIDEPEVSLHIDWQRKIVDQILQIARTGFVLVATHSPDVIYHHHEKVIDLGSGIEE